MWQCHYRSPQSELFHSEYRYGRHGNLRKLYRKRQESSRGGDFGDGAGYICSNRVRSHHLPGVLLLWDFSGCGAESHFPDPADSVPVHAGRTSFRDVLLCLPVLALGFNVWSFIQPLREGNCIMDLEDFFVSNLVLPIGSMIVTLFCTWKYGWGFENYMKEVNTGTGLKVPAGLRFYFKYILPCIIGFVVLYGLVTYF